MATFGTILFARNTNFYSDPRLRKTVKLALDEGYRVIVLDWPREALNSNQQDPLISQYGTNLNIQHCRIKSPFGLGFKNAIKIVFFNIWLLKKLLGFNGHVTIYYSCDLDTSIPILLMSSICGKKCIYDIYDFYAHTRSFPKMLKGLLSDLEYSLASNFSRVIVCSSTRANLFIQKTGKSPVVIQNIPDLSSTNDSILCEEHANHHNHSGTFTIAYAGTLASSGRLLREITELISIYTSISLKVCGSGPLDSYFLTMSQSFENIQYYGQLSTEEAILMQSKANLLFATYDPSIEINKYAAPNKLYEAMSLGLPIIVCKGTDPENEVLQYQCGTVIDYNAQLFMSAVEKYASNPSLCRFHGTNGRRAYLDNFQWSSVSQILADTLSMLTP